MAVAQSLCDMLRISGITEREPTDTTLRLEGQVAGPWVAELRRVCSEAMEVDGPRDTALVLDLTGVSFLDADGIALFRELSRHRVQFTNGSAFIAEQLKGVADVNR
jgi:anti-anti-sigma regulatory factor